MMRVPPYVQFEHKETSLIEQPRKEERSDWVLKLIQRRQIHQLPQNADLNTCRTPLNKVNQFSFTNPLQTFMNLNPYRKTKSWHSIVELLKYLHTKAWYFTITSQFGQAATWWKLYNITNSSKKKLERLPVSEEG